MRYEFKRKPLFMIILFCAAAGVLIAPASAAVTDWELSPACPSAGDVIRISGEAADNEIIEVSILHEEMVPVSGKKYTYQINKLTIPSGEDNSFKVTATGENDIEVKDMNVRVKKFKWFTRHADALDGTVTVSQSNVPSWMSYFVKIDGDVVFKKEESSKNNFKVNSDNGQVKLVFKTSYEAEKADSNGDFTFTYDTNSLPEGNYTINIGDIEKEFTLNTAKETKEKKTYLNFLKNFNLIKKK
ncbi:hypothetical protein ACSAZL_05640 [Methanosarcina sp. T3]|uniref:hypothetical protein n=1 Tax=Methanosarcina sp. T3 TaxID=3439062 RepID=UPI003F87F717